MTDLNETRNYLKKLQTAYCGFGPDKWDKDEKGEVTRLMIFIKHDKVSTAKAVLDNLFFMYVTMRYSFDEMRNSLAADSVGRS